MTAPDTRSSRTRSLRAQGRYRVRAAVLAARDSVDTAASLGVRVADEVIANREAVAILRDYGHHDSGAIRAVVLGAIDALDELAAASGTAVSA